MHGSIGPYSSTEAGESEVYGSSWLHGEQKTGARKSVQELRALIVHAEGLDLVPSMQVAVYSRP